MKIVNLARRESAWRGYEYYINGNVLSYEEIEDGVLQGKVRGSDNSEYNVIVNINRPRNSSCDCPFAKSGTRIVCKHQVALYFAAFPTDAIEYKKRVDKEQAEYEEWVESLPDRVESYIRKLSKAELQEQLIDIVLNSEDWILDRYIRDHDIDDE